MITTEEATMQVIRLSGLRGWPRNEAAISELIKSLEKAHDSGTAESVVSEWLAEYDTVPRPADLWRLVRERNPPIPRKADCPLCGGNGFTPVWFLVTYRGNSMRVMRSERLSIRSQPEADAFAYRIEKSPKTPEQDYQDVVRAVERCECNPERNAA